MLLVGEMWPVKMENDVMLHRAMTNDLH